MTRRKSVCLNWTLVLLVVLVCPSVYTRPQEVPAITTNGGLDGKSTQSPIRDTSEKYTASSEQSIHVASIAPESTARDVKSKTPIRESIEMVAIQLLDKPNSTVEAAYIADTRMPPKLKTQVKHKIRTRNEDEEQLENVHAGEAVPVTIEELGTDNKLNEMTNESSTSNEGISTWHSLSNGSKGNSPTPTEPTKLDEKEKKIKPVKNKPKRPQINKLPKRPIIGSTNKADLVAGGSAINENVFNKLKDTVLTNVQKNKNTSIRPSTATTTTTTTTTEVTTTKKEIKPAVTPGTTASNKTKKKNKNKQKTTSTTSALPIIDDSVLLPTEAKEQEIELEVSTPATTTKKPKRNSSKKKNKTKKRKTSTPKPSTDVAISDVKTANKTKTNKNSKKPAVQTGAITTQIYNYLSREVMPSVGVGVLGLASLVGLAGYFLYPFATPVRRTFEVDKSDDLYRNNAEEYANDGNGQAEEEMLGTVLAGMPAHAKQKLNPYAAQTAHINRYPAKKEQDIRYRYVTPSYSPNYKMHYAQQKTGIAHAAVYSKPLTYAPYDTRHVYTTEGKYNYEKTKQPNYTPYSAAAVEPIYAAPQTGPSGLSSYGSDASNSVVYGVKPSSESDFKPVYPFEGQFFSETTNTAVTYSPTSMYLGLNNNGDNQEDVTKFEDNSHNSAVSDNQFVVGNVPKELSDSATPAVVPEHGPRKLRKRRSISDSLEELLSEPDLYKDVLISNEIDDFYSTSKKPIRNFELLSPPNVNVFTPYDKISVSEVPQSSIVTTEISDAAKSDTVTNISNPENTSETNKINKINSSLTAIKSNQEEGVYVENVSTAPIRSAEGKTKTTESDSYDEPESISSIAPDTKNIEYLDNLTTEEIDTMSSTESSTETKPISELTDTFGIAPSTAASTEEPVKQLMEGPLKPAVTTTESPDLITYPPIPQYGIYSLLQKIVMFKLKLGLGLIQSTVDVLNKLKMDTKSVLNSV